MKYRSVWERTVRVLHPTKGHLAFFILCIFVLSSSFSNAEYRAYQLEITTPSGSSQLVTSTLDAHQYTAYYHVPIENSVLLKNHWMCFGRTSDFKPICPPPKSNPSPAKVAPAQSK